MIEKFREQKDDPLRQTINTDEQVKQRDQYRSRVIEDPGRNTGLPGYQEHSGKGQRQKKGQWHKSSQDAGMLQKDDQYLDDDNNMRKDADINLDQRR